VRSRTTGILVLAALALATAAAAPAGAGADTGFPGPSFAAPTNPPTAPSADKPQSKLWFHDGIWWGSLYSPSAGADGNGGLGIHRLDTATQTWTYTGTLVDDRNSSQGDALPDGSRLYIASVRPEVPDSAVLMRYAYDAAAKVYRADAGFPVAIPTPGPVETISLDKDSRGNLWVAYESGGSVYAAHTSGNDAAFGAPYVLPVSRGASNLNPDDIAAVVAYRSRIGVMWSNQNDGVMYFASHRDGRGDGAGDWTLDRALARPGYADDHINLKSLQADPAGRIFAATKTSLDDDPGSGPNAPLLLVLVLRPGGDWTRHTFGRVSDDHTRPIVLTNSRTRRLYVFATSPTGGGSVYYKQTSLDRIRFPGGRGTPFIQSGANPTIDNATSTRQDLRNAPGLVVLASDSSTSRYLHNVLSLDDRTRPVVRGLRVRGAGRRRVVSLRISETARVRFRVQRARGGRYVPVSGRFARRAIPGRNRFRFGGRLRSLAAGRYRLVAVASDGSGNRSRAKRTRFVAR
jgi:hypothetical protein